MITAEDLLHLNRNKGQRLQMSEKNVPVLALDIDDVQDILINHATNGKKSFSFINGGILSDEVIGELKVAGYIIYLSKIGESYSTCIEWKRNSAKKYLNFGEFKEL